MNAVGRNGQRSGSSGAHHQRQYSDNYIENSSSSNGQWLQSTGLQHLQTQTSNSSSSMDFAYYGGGGVHDSRMYNNNNRNNSTVSGGTNLFSLPLTPPGRQKKLGGGGGGSDDPGDFSPGLLDLHSFDTELISEVPMASIHGASLHNSAHGRSFDDADPYYANTKQSNRLRGLPENNLSKSFAPDKEKASSVAKIKVVVRKRPLNKKELAKNEEDIITTESHCNSLAVHETKLKVDLTEYVEKHEFVFDAVLNEEVSNDEVYYETVEPIVPIIFQRTKATCFAYGQTGSGKTFTMKPLPLKASRDILRLMHQTYRGQGFQLKLCMREDGKQQVCIVGLQEYRVSDVETIKELIDRGNSTRSTGTTGANEESSRSHAILQLSVKRSVDGSESKPARVVGKLSFIDLAGSERGADTTDNDKQTSLLALKECIRALDNDQGHIPFRGSKLTEVLRDSFVGNSRTVMVSCISPNAGSCEHTLNTLRYADRVKSLSKGNKKDAINLRESTTVPLSSAILPVSPYEDGTIDSWPNQPDEDDYDTTEEFSEPEPPSWKNSGKFETQSFSNVEDTMDIVRVEMNLLVEADDPGNQVDDYVTKLNTILAQKAAAILQLQNRLAHFQKRLRDHNVLISSSELMKQSVDFSVITGARNETVFDPTWELVGRVKALS
ncbi:Kinesin, motor domain-containing protein [Cynara cardunculus var. scolymus]|uniref:Kinesin-like protein n=1 Tax=Cynara cardunculus var. scolymus TaxID=59895 RepID=A0A118K3H6_CYNCS|nr:Kinesin, motor domain-containing protein [Cynara cardunculus var. scolymus]